MSLRFSVCLIWLGVLGFNTQSGPTARAEGFAVQVADPVAAKADEHPLMPALNWAKDIYKHIDTDVKDYTCTFVKRERHDGKVSDPEFVFAKFRNQPYSVYMRFVKPAAVEGQEAIYVDGQNNNNLVGRGSGIKRIAGWVSFVPTSPVPMKDNHYPITEAGVRNLTKRLIEVAENDVKYGECEVKFYKNAKINGSSTTCVQVVHPTPRKNFLFHKARIYVDDELKVPVRYEAYDWPAKAGDDPQLIEEYTYLNMKINLGLTDADFDTKSYK